MTLKIGDKVRFLVDYNKHHTDGRRVWAGDTGTVTRPADRLNGDGILEVRLGRGPFVRCFPSRLERIEPEPPRPLGLQPGDKVVNLKTGREGLVLKGPISGELKVYDQKPPIKDAVSAAALEEYEFHYPGTYDVWRRVTEKKKAQPW